MKVELKTIYGHTFLEDVDPNFIANVQEGSYSKWSFMKSFPFLKREIKPYVKFRELRTYTGSRHKGPSDLVCKLDCSLPAFCELVGFKDYKSFDEAKMNAAIKYGE